MGSRRREYDRIVYYTFSDQQKDEVLKKLEALLTAEKRVVLAYVFGSFTRRNNVRDMDVAVYAVPALSFNEFLDLGGRVELELGFSVDVVQLQDLNPAFRIKVLRHGLPVVIKDKRLSYVLMAQANAEIHDLAMCLKELSVKTG